MAVDWSMDDSLLVRLKNRKVNTMTDKVQKIKDWISKEQDGLIDTQSNFGYPEHEGAYNILCNLDTYIDSLQEEPVKDRLAFKAIPRLLDMIEPSERAKNYVTKLADAFDAEGYHTDAKIVRESLKIMNGEKVPMATMDEESVSDDLGEYIYELSKRFPEVSFAKLSRIAVRVAKWQKDSLWKPADGDDLPEIDREVIALLNNGKVVFAHRPDPKGWDAKSIITEKVEHYTPETYDKGGWNIPDVKYWLDVELPKEIEL